MDAIDDQNEPFQRLFGVAAPWLALREAHPQAGIAIEIGAAPRVAVVHHGDEAFNWQPALDADDVLLLEAAAPVVNRLLSDRAADEIADLAAGRHGPLALALLPAGGFVLLLAGAAVVGVALEHADAPH